MSQREFALKHGLNSSLISRAENQEQNHPSAQRKLIDLFINEYDADINHFEPRDNVINANLDNSEAFSMTIKAQEKNILTLEKMVNLLESRIAELENDVKDLTEKNKYYANISVLNEKKIQTLEILLREAENSVTVFLNNNSKFLAEPSFDYVPLQDIRNKLTSRASRK